MLDHEFTNRWPTDNGQLTERAASTANGNPHSFEGGLSAIASRPSTYDMLNPTEERVPPRGFRGKNFGQCTTGPGPSIWGSSS